MKSKILILFFFSFTFTIGQRYRITKILETNLFELDNNVKVKLYGLFVPALNDTNIILSNLADEILKWETRLLLDRKFDFEFLKKNDDGTISAIAYISYAFSKSDLASRFLSNGYAILLPDVNKDYYSKLIEEQERAQKNKVGIWKENLNLLQLSRTPIPITDELISTFHKKYEHPYIPLLAISVASFTLALDNFSSASDIQKTIDFQKKFDKNFDSSELESSKTRKSIVGITCLVAGVITTLFSFKSVEVKTNLQSLSLSYRF